MDPVVLFFVFGLVAGLMKSELRLPPAIYEFLSIILLLSIGLKGGIELSKEHLGTLLPQMVIIGCFGFLLPVVAYPILRYLGKFDRPDAASIAAHYGSVSVGTYAVAIAYLVSLKISYENHMPVFLAVLEIPAIITGVFLARGITKKTKWRQLSHEVFLGKSIVLLVGGLILGWVLGPAGVKPIAPLFFDLFKGVLALFLLEMGLIAASHVGSLKKYGIFLLFFGVLMPLFSGTLGIGLGKVLGLSLGGTMLLATLAGSASYIAVPAALRIMIPEAKPSLSLAASLGVTFPFNVIFGIPIYLTMAKWIFGLGG